jgi:transposase
VGSDTHQSHLTHARSSSVSRRARGPKKAIVAASLLTVTYFILCDGVAYRDPGMAHFDRRDRTKTIRRLVRRLTELGYQVELKAVAS